MAIEKTINIKVNSSDAEKKLKGLDKQVEKTTTTAKKSGEGLSGAFGGMGAAISGTIPMLGKLKAAIISTGIGALVVGVGALVGIFTSASKKGAEFEKSLSTLQAVSGSTASEMGELSLQAKELGSTTQFTAVEVVKLQSELAKLGFTAKDIKNSTPAILSLASSLEVDLASAAELAGSTVRAFGLTTNDTARVVDVMALSTSSSALNFEALRESIKIVAPAARATGVSIEKTAALLGILANNGLKGSVAGTGLSKSFIELNKQGITLEEGMAKVARSSNKLNTAIELVGVVGAKSFLSLAESGKEIEKLQKDFEGASGAAQAMAEIRLDNLSGDVTKLQSAWEGLLLGIEDGTGAMSKFLRSTIQAATAITSFFTATESVVETLEDERLSLFKVEAQLNDTNIKQEDRIKLIEDLQKKYPKFLNNLNAEKVTNKQLAGAIKLVNNELVNKIILAKEDEKIQEQTEKQAQAKIRQLEIEDQTLKRVAENRKTFGKILEDVDMTGTFAEQLRSQSEALNDFYLSAEGDAANSGTRMALKSAQRSNDFAINRLKISDKFLENEEKRTAEMAEARIELKKRLGIEEIAVEEEINIAIKDVYEEATEEEKEARLKFEEELAKTIKKAADIELKNKLSLLQQIEDAENGFFDRNLTKQELEIQVVNDKYFNLIEQAKKYGEDISVLEQAQGAEIIAIKDANAKAEKKIQDENTKASIELSKKEAETKKQNLANVGNALGSFAELAGKETAAGKALAISQALISTYQSAQSSYASLAPIPIIGPALGIAAAGAAVAGGLKQIQSIKSVKVPNSGGGGGGASVGGSVGAAPAPPSFNVVGASDTSQLADAIGGQSQQPVQAYVVSNDVTTAQSLQNNIVEGATIG